MAACNTAEVTDVVETGPGKSACCMLNISRPRPRQLGFGLIRSLTEIKEVDSLDLAATPEHFTKSEFILQARCFQDNCLS